MGTTLRKTLQVGDVITVALPWSEVMLHMGIQDQHRAVQVLPGGAQVLNPDGSPFSFPVLHGEAGIYRRDDGTLWADADRTVRDLPGVRFVKAERYDGTTPEEPSEGDVQWPYGSWSEALPSDATHAVLELTVWSDYGGSTVERSNGRSLRRDFPDTFVRLYGDYGTSGLMLPTDRPASYDADTWEYLLEQLAHLADYPLYDEEDHSALELELADESWDAYLRSDVTADLAKRGVPDSALEDTERLRERFYEITYSQDYGPECETADSAYFPFYDDTVATMAAELGAPA